jgi:hypothetical protein
MVGSISPFSLFRREWLGIFDWNSHRSSWFFSSSIFGDMPTDECVVARGDHLTLVGLLPLLAYDFPD